MSKIISWGIIGGGKVVETKSGPAFNRVPNSRIHSIMRREAAQARETANHLGADKWYTSVEELLADDTVDAVYIATPPGLHLKQALACCRRGLPIYIEKPIALNFHESLAIINEFESASIPIFVAHYRRALPHFKRLRSLILEGTIGKVIEIDFRLTRRAADYQNHPWLFLPELSGGGKFIDISPHFIDILIFLFGSIKTVYGIFRNCGSTHNQEDIVTMSFETETGIVGSANFNFLSNSHSDILTIYGSEGYIRSSIHENDPIHIYSGKSTWEEKVENPIYIEEPMIAEVVLALRGLPSVPCFGREALETYRVIDRVMGVAP